MTISTEFKPVGARSETVYRHLKVARAEQPIFYSEEYGCWVFTRYDDIVEVLMNNRSFTTDGSLNGLNNDYGPEANAILAGGIDWRKVHHLQNTDGDDHLRVRGLLQSIVSPDRVRQMEPLVRAITTDLIDTMIGEGRCEFVAAFSYPLPIRTIFRIIGFDENVEDMQQLQIWSDDTFKMFLNPMAPDEEAECARNAMAFQRYMRDKIEQCRSAPRDDLMTELVRAADAGESDFTDDELILLFTLNLIGAGHSTTLGQITNMVYQLLKDPARWQQVLDNPAAIPEVVEEIIRYAPSTLGWFRVATEDLDFHGHPLRKGQLLFLSTGSANRDEKKFDDGESFCPMRKSRAMSLTFMRGFHACPGSHLARLELRIALEELSKRIPSLRLAPGQHIEYIPSLPARVVPRLEVEWDVA